MSEVEGPVGVLDWRPPLEPSRTISLRLLALKVLCQSVLVMVHLRTTPPDQGTVPPISMSALALNTSQIQAIDFQCLISTVGSSGGPGGDYEQRGVGFQGQGSVPPDFLPARGLLWVH